MPANSQVWRQSLLEAFFPSFSGLPTVCPSLLFLSPSLSFPISLSRFLHSFCLCCLLCRPPVSASPPSFLSVSFEERGIVGRLSTTTTLLTFSAEKVLTLQPPGSLFSLHSFDNNRIDDATAFAFASVTVVDSV